MVEAVIVLPVLAILLFGILYVKAFAIAQQSARVTARRCAWQHAMNGCGEIPAGCENLDHAASKRAASAVGEAAADADGALDKVIDKAAGTGLPFALPLIGDALEGLFGAATQFTASREVRRGRDTVEAQGRFYLLCNAKPMSPRKAIETLFCKATTLCKEK